MDIESEERYGILEDSEGDLCRVCRGGVEEGPLFKPCRCMGSIRWVHESCLIEWLSRSKKTKCELCDTTLHFTKIYAKTMPEHLPFLLLLRRFIQSIFSAILLVLRAVLVASCWLVILPYSTIWILRSYLLSDSLLTGLATTSTKSTSHSIYGSELLQIIANTSIQLSAELKSQILNQVVLDLPSNSTMDQRKTLLVELLAKVKNGTDLLGSTSIGNLSSMVSTETAEIFKAGEIEPWRRLFNRFMGDVFSGQITASIVVVFFVVGFLLREWILINAQFQPQPPIPILLPIPIFPPAPIDEDDHAWRSVDGDGDEDEWEEDVEEDEEEEEYAYDSGSSFAADTYPHTQTWGYQPPRSPIESSSTSRVYVDDPDEQESVSSSQTNISPKRSREERAKQREARRNGRSNKSRRKRPSNTTTSPPMNRTINPLPRANEVAAQPNPPPFRFDFQFEMPPHPQMPPFEPFPLLQPQLPPALEPIIPPPGIDFLAAPFNLPVPPLAPPNNPFDPNGEEEIDLMDDFEGVLEAVGMRGPMLVLVQNFGLMNLLIGLCLGVAFWIPLIVGRLLVVFDAIRIVSIPLRAVRSISDPILDFIFDNSTLVVKTLFNLSISPILSLCPVDISDLMFPINKICQLNSPVEIVSKIASETLAKTTEKGSSAVIKATLLKIAATWTKMSYAEDTMHRTLCVGLGYGGILLAGMIYINSTNTEYGEAVNRAIREGIKQQLTLMKVCIFVFVELIIFPFTCGLFLNLATLPVFPEATIATRIAFHYRAPLSALLITWLIGTIFMFCFSIAIDAIRDTFRKGSLWFIRDPASADFHPIREILERNSGTQARKIATSALLYASVIFATFGLSILFIKYACVGILPLRWTYERTLALPVDLVVFRFVIPFVLQLGDPRSLLRKTFLDWSKLTAHHLRLTSFVFGGPRDPTEEGSHVRRTWKARLTLKRADINLVEEIDSEHAVSPREVVFRPDGGFGRVPAVDGVRVVPGRRMLVRVHEDGRAIDAEGLRVIYAQIAEANTIRPQDRYEIVYLPPNFKTRLALFIYLLFFSGTLAGMTCILIPLLVGRYTFDLFTTAVVHDIYSFVIGSFILGSIGLVIRSLASIKLYRPKVQHINVAFHSISAAVTALVLLPILASAFFSLYIMLPLSIYFPTLYPALSSATTPQSTLTSIPLMFASTDGLPTFYILPSWTTGTVLLNVAYHIFCLRTTVRNPWRVQFIFFRYTFEEVSWSLALKMLNMHVLWPLLWSSTLVVVTPGLLALYQASSSGVANLISIYSTAAVALFTSLVVLSGQASAKTWVLRLREEEYLVEKKLQNYGENSVEGAMEVEGVSPLEGVDE